MFRSRSRFCVAALAIATITFLVAAPRATAQPAAPACTRSLDGHVVDSSTHEVVPGASVSVDAEVVAITDENGRFVLDSLCPGERVIEVERADYQVGRWNVDPATSAAVELELTVLGNEIIVVEGEAPPPVDMRSATVLSAEDLERKRGRPLAETIADVPGVAQLGSASGMGKPIVRGQFGRRLLLLVDAIRHRSQEWGLDHAPEIDPFVADRVTVVRGAAGVRYGPDAIGGAVLVDPPPLLRQPGLEAEAHLIGLWNGSGLSFASRLRGATARLPGLAWQLEGSVKRLASPRTPDYALDNTAVREWNLGGTGGYRTGDAEYTLSYRRYQAALGVCSCVRIESTDDFYAQLERDQPVGAELYSSDFEVERPSQAVSHDLALARGRWKWPAVGTVTATYAFQFDHRREYDVVRDATTGPQFSFRLFTNDVDVGVEHHPIHLTDHLHLDGSAGVVGMVQVHRYGGLPLVPDHTAGAGGVYAIERLIGDRFELEAGLRYDLLARSASIERQDFLRLVRSGQLAMEACGPSDGDQIDCASTFHTVSASIGGLRQLTSAWSVKLDLSTASRPPNPDEQYLNGTAPTFPVLGLGKPDLGPETTYSASATTSYQGARVAGEISIYANLITDYIYFAPALDADGEPIFDVLIRGTFPRFVTRPVDAVFYGADGGVAVTPAPWLALDAQLSLVRARNVSDHAYLVFVPPDRLRGAATLRREALWGLGQPFAGISGSYVARQRRFDLAADFAPPPDASFLLGAEVGAELHDGDRVIEIALSGTNLLDARYREYTSLLRYFADQPGRQLMLRLSMHL